ncbi:MAG: hypothetical protein C0501_21170 [Isosphaera sp.]|nr:hypothetical protein [Isosphaera sp.]
MRTARLGPPARPGTVLPILALCLIGLFGFVALAVDLGMLAVSRTECQNGADVAALVGCRTLNNKPGVANSNLAMAVPAASTAAQANTHLSGPFTEAQVQKIEVGQYLYDPDTEQFRVATWTDVTSNTAATPETGSWTAMRVTLAVTQPTYFMKVFGVTAMPTGAVATAVYRPRDVAFAIDMTGSMAFGSTFNFNNRSQNPDNLVPAFGHYANTQANLRSTANGTNGSGEAIARNNYTIATRNGPPIVRNFFYDPVNVSNPAAVAFPLPSPSVLRNAFHNIPASAETPGDSANYVPPTYNFGSYNAFDTTRTNGPTPAPDTFGTMTGTNYVGDRWRRGDGTINKTQTSWATATAGTRAAFHAADLLGYTTPPSGFAADWGNFRDPVWETFGYDLDIGKYRTQRGTGGPLDPTVYFATNVGNIFVPLADLYQSYSMGPGYWGKTFYAWPPDPRFDPAADVTSPSATRPSFDTSGRPMCDWRRRFFVRVTGATATRTRSTPTSGYGSTTITSSTGGAFDPQADNGPWNSGTNSSDGVNEALFRNASGMTLADGTSGGRSIQRNSVTLSPASTTTDTITNQTTENYQVNYPAVLRWLKTGPQTLPPNLRAGRVLYYSSIPDDVTTAGVTGQALLDRVFWKRYIDFVFGIGTYNNSAFLYGSGDASSGGVGRSLFQNDLGSFMFPWETTGRRPYMVYTDSPNRPRLHFWFGPLSMMDFLGAASNWLPGTCYEAQCWQLKAGLSSVIDDVRNNHPNDYVGMVMFAGNHYNDIRVPLGQDYTALKNALFYPKTLLGAINAGDTTSEIRPYNSSFSSVSGDIIPNANGSTDPNTGLAYAYNLLSPSANLPGQYITFVGTPPKRVQGRRGAAKTVILETDGVPNTWRGKSATVQTMEPEPLGYNSYYVTSGWSSGNQGNGHPSSTSEAVKVATQITKTMSDGTSGDSGLSLPNAPAKVYPVAFGDLFDTAIYTTQPAFQDDALKFLADVAFAGGTGPSGATTLPPQQIITGSFQERIDGLKSCMERIFQSGVSVVLIE